MPRIPVTIPLRGLSENDSFAEQPEDSTRDTQNMRPLDGPTGRIRRGQRPGTIKAISSQSRLNGSNKVLELHQVVYDVDLHTYAKVSATPASAASVEWKKTVDNDDKAQHLLIDGLNSGDLLVVHGNWNLARYNSSGVRLWNVQVPVNDPANDKLHAICQDALGNIYVATSQGTRVGQKIFRYVPGPNNTVDLAWEIQTDKYVHDMTVHQSKLYTLQEDPDALAGDDTESTCIVYDSIATTAPVQDFTFTTNTGDLEQAARRIAVRDDGAIFITHLAAPAIPTGSRADLRKFSGKGDAVWSYTVNGAMGYGLVLLSTGDPVTCGPVHGGDTAYVKRFKDLGNTVEAAPSANTWAARAGLGGHPWETYNVVTWIQMVTDEFDNVFVPVPDQSSSTMASSVQMFVDTPGHGGSPYTTGLPPAVQYELPNDIEERDPLSVAVPVKAPEYRGAETRAEFVYVGADPKTNTDKEALFKLRLVNVTLSTGAPRALVNIGVAGGGLRVFDADVSTPTHSGTLTDPVFDASAQYVSITELYGEVFATDGKKVVVFRARPTTSNPNGEVLLYEPTSSGAYPDGFQLLETFNGRLMFLRGRTDPYNYLFAAQGDAYDVDTDPITASTTQAIDGATSEAGKPEDIINGFVPIREQLGLFLCDHSIWTLSGDPMEGGRLDKLSGVIGGAYGRAWCVDEEYNVYWKGAEGGIYMLMPGGRPFELSKHRIARTLQDVDLSQYYIRMAYDKRRDAVHVFQFPYGAGGTLVNHWTWTKKTDTWDRDSYGNAADTSVQPTAVLVSNGDAPGDLALMVGCEDGHVRKFTDTARDDDGVSIDAYDLIGPLNPANIGYMMKFSRPEVVLAADQGGATVKLYSGQDPQKLGPERDSYEVLPGDNSQGPVRMRGAYCFMRIRNSRNNERFAIETLAIKATVGGKVQSVR